MTKFYTLKSIAVLFFALCTSLALAIGAVHLPHSPAITPFSPASGPIGTHVIAHRPIGARVAAHGPIPLAQPPTIASFSPASGPIGTTVIITGNDFNTTPENNIVFFGATKATVSAATATSLTVTVPAGASYKPISVLNGSIALTGYSAKPFITTFTPNKGSLAIPDMAAKVDFATGGNPLSVAIADLDGDGKPDLAVTNSGNNTISIYRNTSVSGSISTASFAAKVDFATGVVPTQLAIGDLDGDGKPDLVTTNSTGNTISIFRNTSTNGSITTASFADKVDIATVGTPRGIAIGDLDGDGKPELVVTNAVNTNWSISIFRNISTSGALNTASFDTKVDFAAGREPYCVAIGDIDGDGKPDLATANNSGGTISLFRNTSTSGSISTTSFAPYVDIAASAQNGASHALAFADFDGDGKLDLAVGNGAARSISILRNTATSGSITTDSFAPKIEIVVGDATIQPTQLAVGDLDGDGKPDVAYANFNSAICVIRNISTSGSLTSASFAAKIDFSVGSTVMPYGIAIGDLDGDGKTDMVSTNNADTKVCVLRNMPVFAASNVTFTNTTVTTTTASWTKGTGIARAVFIGAASTGAPLLVDGNAYPANPVFGKGYRESSGWYCVYNGAADTSVNITGLAGGTTYRLMVVEYGGVTLSPKYVLTANTNNPVNVTTDPGPVITVQPSTVPQTVCITTGPTALTVGAGGIGLTYQWYSNTTNSNSGGTPVATAVGQKYQGGIIAYILKPGDPGYDASLTKGLIAATVDQSTAAIFFRNTTLATNTALGAGSSNTTTITSNSGNTPTTSASFAKAYTGGGFNDWYLPSKDELHLLYLNIGNGASGDNKNIGNFTNANYWSSSTTSSIGAYSENFTNGTSVAAARSTNYSVRAVRSFSIPNPALVPPTNTAGTSYYYIVVSATNGLSLTSEVSGAVTVNAVSPPSVSIAAVPGTAIAANTSVTFTATPTNGGSAPAYQWFKNDNAVGTNSAAYTDAALINGDIITCTLTSNSDCATTPTAASNALTISLLSTNANLSALTLSAGTLNQAFNSDTLAYTVSVSNATTSINLTPAKADTSATVKVNGTLITGDPASGNISLNVGANAIIVTVAAQDTTIKKTYTITVNRALPPTVINVQPSTVAQTLCVKAAPTALSVGATGAGLTYQWYSNTTNSNSGGTPVATAIGQKYQGGIIAYILKPGDPGYDASLTKGLIAATVNQSNAKIFFTSGPNIVTSTALGSGSNNTALIIGTLGSNSDIAANTAAAYAGGGFNDWYLPSKDELHLVYLNIGNGASGANKNIGNFANINYWSSSQNTTSSAYSENMATGTSSSGSKSAGRVVRAIRSFSIPSSDFVPLTNTAGTSYYYVVVSDSNGISLTSEVSGAVTVNTAVAPTVSIAAVPGIVIAANTSVTFTATPTNGGSAPAYQWFKNDNAVGTDSATYTDATLTSGDIITCTLTSNSDCATTPTAASNALTISLLSNNANLSGLTLSAGTLNQAFNSDTLAYTAAVSNATTSISFTPAVSDSRAIVQVNDMLVDNGTASADINLNVGANTIIITVTAQDTVTTKTYAITVNRAPSSNANLSGIALRNGTLDPVFDPATLTYDISVIGAITSIRLTPTAEDSTARIKVNNAVVISGTATATLPLIIGTNTLAIEVTAEDGTTIKNYTLVVTRAVPSNVGLSFSLSPTGTLVIVPGTATHNYVTSVAAATSSVTVTAKAADTTSVIMVEGNIVASGATSAPIPLVGDTTVVHVQITGNDGNVKTYDVAVGRTGSNNLKMSFAMSPASPLVTTTGTADFNYTASVAPTLASVTITPKAADASAVIMVEGNVVASGSVSQPIPLLGNTTIVHFRITAQNGETKTYEITVSRTGASNVDLSYALSPVSPLVKITGPADFNYTTSVAPTLTSVTITPKAADPSAVITVEGNVVASGSVSQPISLLGDTTVVHFQITAQNGNTKSYAITVTRTGASNVSLSLALSPASPLVKVTAGTADYNYTTSVDPTLTSVTLTPKAVDPSTVITVEGNVVPSGSVSQPIQLLGNTTIINVRITAQNGNTKTYTIAVSRNGASNIKMSFVMNPVSPLVNITGTADYNYIASVAPTLASVTITPKAADPSAVIMVEGNVVVSGSVSQPIPLLGDTTVVHFRITAQNGDTKSYAITVTRTGASNVSLNYALNPVSPLIKITGTADYNYTASVAPTLASVTITPKAADPSAVITVEGNVVASGSVSQPILLLGDTTVVHFRITAQNGNTKSYAITVTRTGASNVSLSLALSPASPLVKVTAGTANYNYTTSVTPTLTSIAVKPKAVDPTTVITVEGNVVASGGVSQPIQLLGDSTIIHIRITAQNGNTKTYTITAIKPPARLAFNQTAVMTKTNNYTNGNVAQTVTLHQALSPNGDGLNDVLVISGLNNFPDNRLSVINTAGVLIYETSGYGTKGNVFDGHDKNGTLQKPGTYYYILQYTDGNTVKRQTGYIIIKY